MCCQRAEIAEQKYIAYIESLANLYKNPHPERPFEGPLELIRSIYMITNSCRNSCELLQAKACSNSIASDFYILLITNTQRGAFKDRTKVNILCVNVVPHII